MAATSLQAEADRASVAFHAALVQIGVETVAESLALWQQMPPTAKATSSTAWLKRAINIVLGRRRQTRDLALAYYRLDRALRTGFTIPDYRHPDPGPTVALGSLREEFNLLAQHASQGSRTPPRSETPTPPQEGANGQPRPAKPASGEPSEDDEIDRILIEEIEALKEEEARLEAAAEEEVRIALEALGPRYQQKLVDAIGDDRTAAEVDALRAEAHSLAGARQASAAERVALDGGRSTIWSIANRDKRVIGYVRVSRTGTPCGWCAMLISRGPVYRSEKSATYSDGDKYHDNCHCYALPIYSPSQYDESALFDLNRQYAEEWPRVTRGLSGKQAVSAWRRYIRKQKSARAQVASGPTTNVQEA